MQDSGATLRYNLTNGSRVGFSWQRSHGGLRSTEFETDEHFEQFDRLLRDNNFHITGGASYSFSRFDVFASYIRYVSGAELTPDAPSRSA